MLQALTFKVIISSLFLQDQRFQPSRRLLVIIFQKTPCNHFFIHSEMGSAATFPLPSQLKSSLGEQKGSLFVYHNRTRKNPSFVPVARLFGPAIFEASKLKVLFLGVDEKKHPGSLPRTYTLTHNDITSRLNLAISQSINRGQLQGWYNRLQRDEVVAEWKKIKGKMSLHVHCHISGGHFLLNLIAKLRYLIFSKELPVVLKAFVHGDGNLFNNYPELKEAPVWVYFHSNRPEFNKVECWGPLEDAVAPIDANRGEGPGHEPFSENWVRPEPCKEDCSCCFPPSSLISWPEMQDLSDEGLRCKKACSN